jgi:hypothetical protein
MPLTYSSNLRLTLIGTGEQEGTWGDLTNTNIGALIEQAIAGYTTVLMATDADKTLTALNGATDEARSMGLRITSTPSLTASRNIIVPSVSKLYVVKNSTTGGQSIVVKTAAGSGVTVGNGKSTIVVCDGVDVSEAAGGTVPSGAIMMWSGSIASIPAGWYLCDGTNGTPNLRDRFIVGAGSTYAVNATGGSADATLPSHTHGVSGTTSGQTVDHNHSYSGTTFGQNADHAHGIEAVKGVVGAFGTPYTDRVSTTSDSVTGPDNPTVQYTKNTLGTTNDHGHGYAGNTNGTSTDHAHGFSVTSAAAGTSATNANLPPYLALAYIMKA